MYRRSTALSLALLACGRGEPAAVTDVVVATPSATVDPSADPLVPQLVEFPGNGRTLRGYLYRPSGAGPFPTIVFNHGSEEDPGDKRGQALFYVPHGFALFVPHRRGHGLSGPTDDYFENAIRFSRDRSAALVEQLDLQVDDVAAAVAYAKSIPFVDAERIALVGCSFGGIESLLAAERDLGVRAAIDFAGASMAWAESPALQERMRRAARAAQIPVLLLQAENDYDTSPTRELDEEMTRAGRPHRARIFPPHGEGPADGHAFCTGGAEPPWAEEVSAFLASSMPGTPVAEPQHRVTLARTSGRGSIDAGVTKVFVGADAVLVDETPVTGIEPASHHVLERLADRLDGTSVVAVYPDRSLRYGDVVDILYTAAQTGVEHVEVTVETAHGPAAFRALAPSTWNQHPEGVGEPACNPTLHLDRTRARFSNPCTQLELEAPIADAHAVSKALSTIVDGGSQLSILLVLGASDTPWPTIVDVLDAVRGPDCPLGHTHEDRIAGCNNVLVALDLDPPIPWRPGDWDALEVAVESVEHVELARRRRSLARLRKRAAAALPGIRECLRNSDAMRLRMPARIDVILATDPKGATLAMVDAGEAREHVPACVGEAFAPIAEHWGSLVPGDVVIRLAVRLPADGD